MRILEKVGPSADRKDHYNDISHKDHENGKMVIVTANGREDTVSSGYHDIESLEIKLELLEMLEDSEGDLISRRTAPLQDSFDSIRKELKVNRNHTKSG